MSDMSLPADLPLFTLDRSGLVASWNPACADRTGLGAAEVLHTRRHWRAFFHTPRPLPADLLLYGDEAGLEKAYKATLKRHENGSVSCILRIDRALDGETTLWTQAGLLRDEKGEISGAWQMFQTIGLAQFTVTSPIVQTLIEKFPLPVALVLQSRIQVTNRAYASLTGYDSPEAMIGLPVGTFIDEADKVRFLELNANNHAGLKPDSVYRWRYRVHDRIRYVEGRPVVFPWGNDTALISTMVDVTDAVLKEQELEDERARLEKENAHLLEKLSRQDAIFLGDSPAMRKTMSLAVQMGKTDTNLVILGETGTGKSLLARVIHDVSPRRDHPFVMVNCAAIPEQLLESEFFGYARGAFTGAAGDRQGFLGAAHRGTLFLDEVGELHPAMQAKLLHAVESKRYTPVGGTRPLDGDVRLICATNRDLVQMVRDGALREDFFYRIFVVDIPVPPLRDRKEDLPKLIEFFFAKFSPLDAKVRIPEELIRLFLRYDWPGNVRELQNVILRYLATGQVQFIAPLESGEATRATAPGTPHTAGTGGANLLPHLSSAVSPHGRAAGDRPDKDPEDGADTDADIVSLKDALERAERDHILKSLRLCHGNKVRAAQRLGVKLRTFHRRCGRLGIVRRLPPEALPPGGALSPEDTPPPGDIPSGRSV